MTEKKSKRVSKTFILLSVIGVLLAGGLIFWNIYKYKLIKGKSKDAVFESSHGLYSLHYDKITVDEATGFLYVTNIKIVPDTAMYRKMIETESNPPLLLQLSIPELRITGVKTPKALLGKEMEGRKIEINNADVLFYFSKGHPDTTKAKQEMYQQVLGTLKLIKVDTINIVNASLSFVDTRNNKKTIEGSRISVLLRDVQIDSLHSNDSSRFFFAKKAYVKANAGTVKNEQGTYFYRFAEVEFYSESKSFTVKELKIEPQLSEDKFAAYSKVQNDRFNFVFHGIELKNMDLQQLMQSSVIADELLIRKSEFKIYRDLSYPRDKKSRVGKFPHQLLMNMPIYLSIRKVVLNDAFIEYKEKNPKSDYSGKVQFDHASATITNVTNVEKEFNANPNTVLTFNASFLDMAALQAKITMFLNNKQGRFLVAGSLNGFPAANLNQLLQPMALVRVDKGTIDNVTFNLDCHNTGSTGKLTMLYNDLKISLLKKDSAENTLKKKGLASFVANVIVKNANPLRKQAVRISDIHYERDTNRSFFNLIWKSIFTGAKETVGMK